MPIDKARDENLKKEIENIIAQLLARVTRQERAAGWSENAKDGALAFFLGLLTEVKKQRAIPYVEIVRNLHTWGVRRGSLYDAISVVAGRMNSRGDTLTH
jgi:hypothetical protein